MSLSLAVNQDTKYYKKNSIHFSLEKNRLRDVCVYLSMAGRGIQVKLRPIQQYTLLVCSSGHITLRLPSTLMEY